MTVTRVSKAVLAFFSIAIVCLVPANSAFAITPTFGHKYQNGVGNTTAWLNNASGVGYWSSYIYNGANNWMYPGWNNPIYINFVGSNYGSTMDFHLNYSSYFLGGYNTLAQTKFFNGSGVEISPTSANWAYAEIHINDDAYRNPNFTNAQAQGTTIHEMGHAFGLAHDQGNPYSVMCQTGAGRIVQSVQKVDNDAILTLY